MIAPYRSAKCSAFCGRLPCALLDQAQTQPQWGCHPGQTSAGEGAVCYYFRVRHPQLSYTGVHGNVCKVYGHDGI